MLHSHASRFMRMDSEKRHATQKLRRVSLSVTADTQMTAVRARGVTLRAQAAESRT
jgi:hypothetical protein